MIRIFERTSITHHSFPSIAIDGTGGGPLGVTDSDEQGVHCGILRTLGVSCDSTSFDLSVRTKSNALDHTIDEIYRYTGINRHMIDDNLFLGWENRDATLTRNLYVTIINKDLSKATGTIEITMTNDINRRYSGRK